MKTNAFTGEWNLIITAAAIMAATITTYCFWLKWDSEINAETENVMSTVNTFRVDESGNRIYYKAVRDGSVWLEKNERSSRRERPSLLGK